MVTPVPLILSPDARADLDSGLVHPRILALLSTLATRHALSIRTIKTGHPMGPTSPAGRVNDHFFYRAADLDAVDGVPVSDDPVAPGLLDLGRMLMALPPDDRAARVMGPEPWLRALGPGDRTGFREDALACRTHTDHLHLGVD